MAQVGGLARVCPEFAGVGPIARALRVLAKEDPPVFETGGGDTHENRRRGGTQMYVRGLDRYIYMHIYVYLFVYISIYSYIKL